MRLIVRPEMSANNYQYTLNNVAEEQRSHFRGRLSLKIKGPVPKFELKIMLHAENFQAATRKAQCSSVFG